MCWPSTRPRDADYPLVCLDESSKQLIGETRVPVPMKPGRPARCDYKYERNGTANLFMMFAPLEDWRRLVERFEWHYTPKDGSWAESELGGLSSQCLDRRIPDKPSSTESPPGSTTAMPTTPKQTGNSLYLPHASNSSIYTPQSD
jgi:hypothetical protein